jgi:putative chitinase
MTDTAVVARWRGHLAVRLRLLQSARRRGDHALIRRRERQVAFARRVIARHEPHGWTIDPAALRFVAPWLTVSQSRTLALALAPAFRRYGITTRLRAAAAVAQFCHESAGFRTTTEFASGQEYEGRRDLGNTHPGDGARFKGRGYIQITGRFNYTAASRAFGVDFISHPELLAAPKWAAMASCYWWSAHGCSALADAGAFIALTRRINGGVNGLADRQMFYARALRVASRLVPRPA